MVWCCPQCHDDLAPVDHDWLVCSGCAKRYEVIDGIPDLRMPGVSWVDYEADRNAAHELATDFSHLTADESIRWLFSRRSFWDERIIAMRTKQTFGSVERLQTDLDGWLAPMARPGFLDLGCGAATLLAAAAKRGIPGIGIDVSLLWLVVGKRLIQHHGGHAVLAAALGEALPLRAASVPATITLDVIEHVANPVHFLREIDRVVAHNGGLAFSSPNRFSLAAEPHVFVWGVGWLPRRWQGAYVQWRTGRHYESTNLLSAWEARRIVHTHTSFRAHLVVPQVPSQEIARFPRWRATLARLYNRLAPRSAFRTLLLTVGPFFRIVSAKSAVRPLTSPS